jgi:hypothetical protein
MAWGGGAGGDSEGSEERGGGSFLALEGSEFAKEPSATDGFLPFVSGGGGGGGVWGGVWGPGPRRRGNDFDRDAQATVSCALSHIGGLSIYF